MVLCVWLIATTMLHVCEMSNKGLEFEEDDGTGYNPGGYSSYDSVVNALQLVLVHITGDYPKTAYSIPGKCSVTTSDTFAHFRVLGLKGVQLYKGVFFGTFSNL